MLKRMRQVQQSPLIVDHFQLFQVSFDLDKVGDLRTDLSSTARVVIIVIQREPHLQRSTSTVSNHPQRLSNHMLQDKKQMKFFHPQIDSCESLFIGVELA